MADLDSILPAVRIERSYHEALVDLAAASDRTLAGEMRRALRSYIDTLKEAES
jgi:hypothetical protein